ncbi:DNA polymerase zeta catalytic subunit [Halictus rubicundus]|uniref:DNA polymerase zeta catalytic subunit n=1 Tax=Halictus rubicundus TaxID=77578 RepID=UPI0040351B85
MFCINLVTLDSYQSPPLSGLDVTFSDFRGTEIKYVPVIRIFGSTPTGLKTCLHIHGVFPYIYIPCTIEENIDSFMYRLAAATDSAINVSLGSAMSKTQHVYKIERISGIPLYGYHETEHLFFKIYFYNPAMVKRAADLLQNGTILNQSLQPHEAHIPFVLQFMIDYNLYGMSLINLKNIKYRQHITAGSKENSQNETCSNSNDSRVYLPASVIRQSTSRLEVDARATEILNKEEIENGLDLNPGIAAIWNNERYRREDKGLQQAESQLLYTNTNDRVYGPSDSDIYQEERLIQRLQTISQVSGITASVTSSALSYPLEVEDKDNSLNASRVSNHFKSNMLTKENEEKILLRDESISFEKFNMLKQTLSQDKTTDVSQTDVDDVHLIEMLANLAKSNEEVATVDDDSVLASQYSVLSNEIKEDNEDEVEDLNITSLDLDDLSTWNTVSKIASQLSTIENENGNEKFKYGNDRFTMFENDIEDVTLLNFPQCDGSNDLILENEIQLPIKSEKYETIISKPRNLIKIQEHDNLNQKAVIPFQVNSNNVSNMREKMRQILLNHSLSQTIVFNSTLFDSDIHNFLVHIKLDKKQIRNCRNRKRKTMKIVGNDLLLHGCSTTALNIYEPDHQDLDVYDIDDINHYSLLIENSNFKNTIDDNETHFTTQNSLMKVKIPSFDGNTVDSSSDSDLDLDITTDRQEERICIYKSGQKLKNEENLVNISFKKRKLKFEDSSLESPQKRRHTSINVSPRSTGKYSSLNITIMSPKAKKFLEEEVSWINKPCGSRSTFNTPKRNKNQLRMNLLCENISSSASKVEQAHLTQNSVENVQEPIDSTHTEHNSFETMCTCEVRKRLSFLDTNDKEVGSIKGNENYQTNYSQRLSSVEKITSDLHDNDFTTIVPVINFIDDENLVKTCTREDEKINCEDNLSSMLNVNADLSIRTLSNNTLQEYNEDEDISNMTYTQFLTKKLESEAENLNVLSLDSTNNIMQDKLIIITTKFNSPNRERIINTMKTYNVFQSNGPFFSKKIDLLKQKENSIKNSNIEDVIPFKSSLERVTGIKLWRRLKINQFYPSGSNIKSYDIKRVLTGHCSITIRPLIRPPTAKSIKLWIQAKKYLLQRNIEHIKIKSDSNEEIKKLNKHTDAEASKPIIDERIAGIECSKEQSQISNSSRCLSSNGSNNSLNPSLRKVLENPLLYKSNDSLYLGISYGQIEYSMKEHSNNAADENYRNSKGLLTYQCLTILSLEVHATTRGKLLPDPEHDSIEAIFYAIHNDVPSSSDTEQIVHGAIVVNSSINDMRIKNLYSTSTMCPTSYVSSEEDLLNSLITLLRHCDADILVGWEIESHSWGYVVQRANHIGFNNFTWQISRISNVTPILKNQASDRDNINDAKIPGRIVLDVWRIMRHEIALLNYTFENVMYHVLHERVSCPTFQHLTDWWKHNNVTIQWKVISHYVARVVGTLRMLLHLDIIGTTCEHARLYGIQFYEVFSRGSQFRVESMMLRLAKPLNYIAVSPSVQQRARMQAPESLPLIMEPQSIFYTDPIVVLDFQSLYPSIIIAYNYCFSTCLGRIEHVGQAEPFEFGASMLKVKKSTIQRLQGNINFTPCGVAFVKPDVRLGVLPRMLMEILNTRLMVKQSMKLHGSKNRVLQRVLHSQQLGLKLIANVTYGYTSANFSGRMPCIEVGDSVVSKGRETLERAIKIVEATPKWGAQVVYGDTDSLFILLPGKSKDDAFAIGAEMADTITAANPAPVKLKFEKVLQPSILQTKKRYCGYMYESPDQKEPEFLAKGIETIRRDGCPAATKILEKTLKILFDTKDLSLVKLYVTRQFDKILRRKISIQDLTFAKEFRGLHGYKANASVPALELTRRLMRKDPRAVPRTGERVRYVIVAGAPNQPLIQCVRTPMEVISDEGLNPNSIYYITKVIVPPLNRCLNLIGIDVNAWYREMSHRQTPDKAVSLFTDNHKQTIRQFFSTFVCAACGGQTQKDICTNCAENPTQTIIVLHEKLRWLERTHSELTMICRSCTGYLDDVKCESLDCPVFYRLAQAKRDLVQVPYLNNIIYNRDTFCTERGNTKQ